MSLDNFFFVDQKKEKKTGQLVDQEPDQNHMDGTKHTAMGCRQCLSLSVVQLKGKRRQKTHCRNGVVETFESASTNKLFVHECSLYSLVQAIDEFFSNKQ